MVEKKSYDKNILPSILSELGTNLIVKPYNGGSSIGVTKCQDTDSLHDAIALAFTFGDQVIIEPFLTGRKELCCSVTSINHITTATLLEDPNHGSEVFSFDDKYKVDGGSFTGSVRTSRIPAQLDATITEKIRAHCITVFDFLHLHGVPRIDRLVNEQTGECVIIEINAIPGNLALHIRSASGVTPRVLLQSLIDQAQTDIRKNYEAGKTYATDILKDYAKLGGRKMNK